MARSKVTRRQKMDLSVNHPQPTRCSNLTAAAKQCQGKATVRVTRSDATSYLLCTRCANLLTEMMAKRPDVYARVTITQLT